MQHSFVRRTTLTTERSSLPRFLALAATGLLFAALPAAAKPKATPVETAVIENSGSTNTVGYQIGVSQSGTFQYHVEVPRSASTPTKFLDAQMMLPKTQAKKLAEQLFADLAAAMPLTDLPVRHGMRSASFGTQTFITYKGQKSPDLTFASDPRTAALKADIDAITKTLHIGNAPRRPIVIHADR